MFSEYEAVRIKTSGKTGIIVDKAVINGVAQYAVEDDEFDKDAPYGGSWPVYFCTDADLERISA